MKNKKSKKEKKSNASNKSSNNLIHHIYKLHKSKQVKTKIETTKEEHKNTLLLETEQNSKVIKFNTSTSSRNRMIAIAIVVALSFIYLIFRLAYVQFVTGEELTKEAYQQQAINQIISPNRGNIYDSTGETLAISVPVDTITINPTKLEGDNDEETKLIQETVSTGLSEIFDLTYEEVYDKVTSGNNVETIAQKIENDKVNELTTWMEENDISSGINIDEDTKRYYPYDTVASNLIGFVGTENQGLAGLENTWNDILTGTPGKIVSSQGSDQQLIPNTTETYVNAENGSDITLTIDLNIQSIAEQYLKQAVDTYVAEDGGNVIIMDPQTGDILAMASYPDYNLNDPFTAISDLGQEFKDESIYRMWNTRSVAETYEPGSTFKVITSAIALEENITGTDVANDFICTGFEEFENVYGGPSTYISCWSTVPHGSQTLRDALGNSCNPAFMQLGERITTPVLYKYYDAFGFFDSTNSSLYGEQSSIFLAESKVGPVDEATMSFGQGLNITPLQLITAISAIANDGVLMQPRIVDSITNTDTKVVTEMPIQEIRQVISKETADEVKSLMESVVLTGSGGNAAVEGYTVGGKTGTSEDLLNPSDKDDYISSFVAISPVEDTSVVVLLTLYEATSDYGYHGGQIAAPTVSQMLTEILPYLGIPSSVSNTEPDNLITVPNIENKTITQANQILQDSGLNTKIYSDTDHDSTLVASQNPKPGSSLLPDSTVFLYGENNNISTSVTVPDLSGKTLSEATVLLEKANLNVYYEGTGIVTSQDYEKNSLVPEGTIIRLTLKPSIEGGY